MLFKISLLVALVATSAFAVPTGQRSSCSVECTTNDKYFYEIGKNYEYQYTAQTKTGTSESTNEVDESDPGVSVEATVQIHVMSPCEYMLMLNDVKMESLSSHKFSTELTKNPLRFSMKNGKIEIICPSTSESVWALNFKKGILSTFQNSMNTKISHEVVTETDVSGVCKTVYEMVEKEDEMVIKKTKVPTECTKKPQTSSQLASFGFNMDSIVDGMNPIVSEQSCIHVVSDNIVKKVTCNEMHTFKPFAHQDSGKVYTTAKTFLNFVQVKSGLTTYRDTFDIKTELTYDLSELEEMEDLVSTEEILSKLGSASENGVQKEVPQLFSELVSLMKKLTKAQLDELVTTHSDSHVIKFVFDAIPLVGTTDSNEFIVDLITEGKYSEKDTALYYTSLAFIKRPTEDMFVPLMKLLKHENKMHEKAMLGISSLMHNFCETHEDCTSVNIIEQIMKYFESFLGVSCRSNDEEIKNDILVALKSMGNVGQWMNGNTVLGRCFMENNPTEVRIAAIEAWRRSPCDYNRNHLLSTYEDSSYDSEVRIAAYLQVMKCPTKVIIDTIKDRLTSEGINHVTSFVWSHLNNMQESAAQDKQWIREMIGEQFLKDKFTTDTLKFSRYFESSMYSKELNVGGSVDADVVFSTESFIPRSAMLNLTVNLFGQSINLFEVGGRIEGYEHFIEKFFGPNGYYPDETIEQVIKNMRDDKFSKSPELSKLVGESTTDPKGSMFARFLGNELFYTSHLGSENILTQLGFKNPMDLITEILTNGNVNFMKNFNLVKSKFTVPTITGFPIKISFDGTATVGFVLDGDFKVEGMNTFDLQGKLKPSAAVNIDSSMTVDAFVTKAGRKFTTTLHSSTMAEGKAIVKSLKIVDFSISIPEKDMTVYEYSHDVIRIDDGEEQKENIDSDMEKSCYPEKGALGLQICSHTQTKKNGEFLTKNLIVKKMDTHTSYDFHFIKDDAKFSVMLDMPNSKESSKHKLYYYFDGKNLEAQLHCPYMHKTIKGMVDLKNKNKMIDFQLLDGPNEKEQFVANMVLENTNTRTGYIIKPKVTIGAGGETVSYIEGVITNDNMKKIIEVQASSSFSQDFMILPTGDLELTWKYGDSHDVVMKFTSYSTVSRTENALTVELSGNGKVTEDHVSLMLDGHYTKYNEDKKEIRVATDLKKETSSDGVVYTLSADIPYFNIKTNNVLSVLKYRYALMSNVQVNDILWNFDTYYISKDVQGEKNVAGKIWLKVSENTNKRYLVLKSYGIEKTFNMNKDRMESTVDISCGIDIYSHLVYDFGNELRYTIHVKDLYSTDNEMANKGLFSMKTLNLLSLDVKIANKGYGRLTYESTIKSLDLNGNIKGVIENESNENKISWKIKNDIIHNYLGRYASKYVVESHLDADGQQFSFKFDVKKTNGYTKRMFLYNYYENLVQITAIATPNSVYLYSNLYQPFKLNAKFSTQQETNKIQAVAEYGENHVEFLGDYSPKKVIGSFKSNDKMIKFSGQLVNNGLETFIMWAPDQKIDVMVKYDKGDKTSVLLSVQTPFQGWRKQEVKIAYGLTDNRLDSSVNVIWKNTEHINFNAKLNWNIISILNNEISGKVHLISTIPNFELVQINLIHKSSHSKILTHFDGKFEHFSFAGKFNALMDITGNKVNFVFTSPNTKSLEVAWQFSVTPVKMAYNLVYSYGTQKSSLQFGFDGTNFPSNYKLKLDVDSPYLPQILFSSEYNLINGKLRLSTMMHFNNLNVLDLTLEDKSDNYKSVYVIEGRLIHPFSGVPMKIHAGFVCKDGIVELDFDMSSNKYNKYHEIKLHSKTNIFTMTPTNIYFVGHYSGYSKKASITIKHKLDMELYEMKSELSLNVNPFELDVYLHAEANPEQLSGSVTTNVTSSVDCIDGVVFVAKHDVDDNTRNTLITYEKDEFKSKVFNSISFYDLFNWHNVLIVDDLIKATNKLSVKGHHYINELDWIIGEHKMVTKFDKSFNGEFETKLSLMTPYTSPLQIEVNHEYAGEKGVFKGKMLQGDAKIMTTQTEYLLADDLMHVKHETLSKFCSWTPLEIEFDLSTKVKKEAKISALVGNKFEIYVKLFDKQETYGGQLSYENKQTAEEVSFEAKHLFSENAGNIFIEGKFDHEVYTTNIEYSILENEKTMSSEFKIPLLTSEVIRTTVHYNNNKKSFTANVINGIEVYNVLGKLDDKSFKAEIIKPSGTFNIEGEWLLENNIGEMKILLSGNEHKSNAGFKYSKMEEKIEGTVYAICNGKEYKVKGFLEETSFSIKSITPENTYEILTSVTMSEETEMQAILMRNSEKIIIKGKGRFDFDQGSLLVSIVTPFGNNEENFVSFMYKFFETKELKLEGKIADKLIFARFIQEPMEYGRNGVKTVFDIKLPIQNYEEISIVSMNEFTPIIKSSEIMFTVMNKEIASADFTANSDKLKFSLKHNDIQINGKFQFSNGVDLSVDYNNGNLPISIAFTYNSEHHNFNAVLTSGESSAHVSGSAKILGAMSDLSISLKTLKDSKEISAYSGHLTFEMSDQLVFNVISVYNNNEYYFKYSSSVSSQSGFITVGVKTPFKLVDEFTIDGTYNLNGDVKVIKLLTTFENVEKLLFAELSNMENKFVLHIETPIKVFNSLKIIGEYDNAENIYKIKGKLNKDDTLAVEGQVTPTIEGYLITVSNQGVFRINGEITGDSISLNIIDKYESEQFMRAKYLFTSTEINLDVESSYPELRAFVMNSYLSHTNKEYTVSFKVMKDETDFNAEIKTKLYPGDYFVKLLMESTDDESYKFEWGLNTQLSEKSVTLIIDSPEFYHFFDGAVSFITTDKSFVSIVKAKSSLPQLRNFHIENNFKFDDTEITNKFRFVYNKFDYTLTLNAIKDKKIYKINADVDSSANTDNLLSFNLNVDTEMKKAHTAMIVNDKVFEMKVNFAGENKTQRIEVTITSPYEDYKYFSLNLFYDVRQYKNIVEVDIHHNTPIVEFKAALSTDIKKPEIHLKFNSRYTDYSEVRACLDLENTIDLMNLKLQTSNNIDYQFGFGYAFHTQRLAVSMKFKSPHQVFGKVFDFKFTTDFKFDENKNALKLYFEKDGDVHMNVDIDYFDEESSLMIHMPNGMLGNFKTGGLFNREKRSIEWQMMNDHHHGELVASFHAVKINLETPFKRIKKLSFSLTKDNAGKWVLNYKRNQNYVDFELGRTSKGIETKIDASVPSWELLALSGRLTEEELEGYLTGELPETQLTLTGKGVLGRKKGEVKWEMNAPDLPTLKKVNAKLDYNVRKGTYTFNANSSTNKDFKIFLQFKRGGLFINVFVPHKDTPTVAKGQLTIFKGKLNISSRFPSIKTYKMVYSVEIKKTVDIKWNIERNGIKALNLEFHKGGEKYHFLVEIRNQEGKYCKFHYHRMGWNHLDVIIHKDGLELSANLKGSGNLPEKGEIAFIVKNSFRVVPREVTGTIKIDRTGSPKTIVMTVEKSPSEVYVITAKYNADLSNMKKGDVNLKIDTSTKKPWHTLNVDWEFDDNKTGHINYKRDDTEIKIKGKVSLKHSDFVVSCNHDNSVTRVYGWKIIKKGNYRDYMVKFGPEKNYTLLALSGTINDIRNVDIQGRIKSRLIKHDFTYKLKWSGNKNIGISGDGSFECGKKNGAFKLHYLKRDPVKRASKFKLTGTSNIKNWSSYSIEGKYDISAKLIDITMKWDNDELSVYTKIDNFTTKKSQNTAKFHIPGVGQSVINFGHDFTNPLDKTVKIDGHFGGKRFHYNEHWTRNAEFTVLNLDVDIESNFIGVIKMNAEYDVRDINNAKGKIVYTRDGKNNVNVDWHRTKTDNSIVNELTVDSKSKLIVSSKAYFKADWERDNFLKSSIGFEWSGKKIEAVLSIDKKMAKFYTKNPFPKIDDITAVLKYDVLKKLKNITLDYERGERKVNFKFILNYKSKKQGSLDILLTTPFEIIEKVTFNVKWNKGKFDAHYQRNQKVISISGKADIKQGKSSFDFVFTPKSGVPIHIKFNYDLIDFFKRTSKQEQQILHLDVDAGEHKLSVNIDGYSSKERLTIFTQGTSSLKLLKTFHLRTDSELNLSNREGELDLKINDFEYRMKNRFEQLENGFYFKTQIHSTLTRLPGLTLGYGKAGKARTITLGYGDEREISISVDGKDEYKKGISGKIDIPRKGIMGIEYDIDYDFVGEDKFNIKAEIRLKNGKKINYELEYHSDGVKSRLSAPIENIRRLRAKRSISDDLDMNEYSVTFNTGKEESILNKGILIEGQMFGNPFSIDTFINLKETTNSQGKLLIKTPFEGYEKLGGHFTIKQEGHKVSGNGEVFFHGHASAEFETNLHDSDSKNIIATVTYTPIDNETPLLMNIIANINEEQCFVSLKTEHITLIGDHDIVVKICPRKDGMSVSTIYNDFELNAQYVLAKSPLHFKFYSDILYENNIIHQGEVSGSFNKEELLFTTDILLCQKSYNLITDINFSDDLHKLELSYENLNASNMKVVYINTEVRKQVSFLVDGIESHMFNLDMHNTDNFNYILEINSKYMPKVYISSVIGNVFKTDVEIATMFGLIETEIEALSDQEGILFTTETKFIGESSYVVSTKLHNSENGHELKGKFSHNENKYLINGKYMITDTEGKAYFEISSPLIMLNKYFIDLGLSTRNNVNVYVKTSVFDQLHIMNIEADKTPKVITMNIISPFVPTGQGKVKLNLEGKSIVNSKIEVLLSNAEKSYFGKIVSKLDSNEEKEMEVYLRTPIGGFEEVHFGGGYKTGSMKKAFVYAHPFNYKAEFFLGTEFNKYNVGFEIVPGKQELLFPVAAKAVIPLNKINPHFSASYRGVQYDADFTFNNTDRETEIGANFIYNGEINGGLIQYTKNFPIELGYKFICNSEPVTNFHIMVDSSIFSLTNVVYLLV